MPKRKLTIKNFLEGSSKDYDLVKYDKRLPIAGPPKFYVKKYLELKDLCSKASYSFRKMFININYDLRSISNKLLLPNQKPFFLTKINKLPTREQATSTAESFYWTPYSMTKKQISTDLEGAERDLIKGILTCFYDWYPISIPKLNWTDGSIQVGDLCVVRKKLYEDGSFYSFRAKIVYIWPNEPKVRVLKIDELDKRHGKEIVWNVFKDDCYIIVHPLTKIPKRAIDPVNYSGNFDQKLAQDILKPKNFYAYLNYFEQHQCKFMPRDKRPEFKLPSIAGPPCRSNLPSAGGLPFRRYPSEAGPPSRGRSRNLPFNTGPPAN